MPENFKSYFWDINCDSLNIASDYIFIISRMLEVGEFNSLNWIISTYSSKYISDALVSGNISEGTKEFVYAIINS